MNKFYGQCWTKTEECDGMWRNYVSLDAGVKIQTTAKKLKEVINNNNKYENSKLNYDCFFGEVKYDKYEKIERLFNDLFHSNSIYNILKDFLFKSLCVKRNAFIYENEARLLAFECDVVEEQLPVIKPDKLNEQNKNDSFDHKLEEFNDDYNKIISFEINPIDLIDSIVFAPKTPENVFNENKKKLIDLGFDETKISKSELYKQFKITKEKEI